MSIEWFIYLASISCGVKVLFGVLGIGGTLVGGLTWCVGVTAESTVPDVVTRYSGRLVIICLFLGITSALIPTERTLYMMAGAHYGMEALQSETAQKVAKLLNGKLDEELAKLGEGR